MKFNVQIPDSIIKNGRLLSDSEFAVFFCLKMYHDSFLTTDNTVRINPLLLREQLGIKTSKTLMAHIVGLYEAKLILNKPENLRSGSIDIAINPDVFNDTPFTQIPRQILSYIPAIGHMGLRLIYYYESFSNRSNKQNTAWPGYGTITDDLVVSPATISKYNSILVESKLLKIKKSNGAPSPTYEYDANDRMLFRKDSNTYEVLLKNM